MEMSFCAGVENEGSNLRYSGPFSWWQDMLHRQPPLTPDRGKALARELPAQFDFKGEKLMLDKPRDRTLWKKLLISAMAISGLGAMTESTYSILGLMIGWAGVLLIAWAIILGIHWFAELEEVGDGKP